MRGGGAPGGSRRTAVSALPDSWMSPTSSSYHSASPSLNDWTAPLVLALGSLQGPKKLSFLVMVPDWSTVSYVTTAALGEGRGSINCQTLSVEDPAEVSWLAKPGKYSGSSNPAERGAE